MPRTLPLSPPPSRSLPRLWQAWSRAMELVLTKSDGEPVASCDPAPLHELAMAQPGRPRTALAFWMAPDFRCFPLERVRGVHGVTLLLDTHTVLWFWWADPLNLRATAISVICDPANRKLVSPATAWEVSIKVSLKENSISAGRTGAFSLSNMIRGTTSSEAVADHGRPFDRCLRPSVPPAQRPLRLRLIVAQAMWEKISIVGADSTFDQYPIVRIW